MSFIAEKPMVLPFVFSSSNASKNDFVGARNRFDMVLILYQVYNIQVIGLNVSYIPPNNEYCFSNTKNW